MPCPASSDPAAWPARPSEPRVPAPGVPSLVFRAPQALAGRVRAGSSHLSPQIPIHENLIYSFVTTGVGRLPELMKCLPAADLIVLATNRVRGLAVWSFCSAAPHPLVLYFIYRVLQKIKKPNVFPTRFGELPSLCPNTF